MQALARYLEQNDISQADFAAKLGVKPAAVSHWVRGRRIISAERAIAIEQATGCALHRRDLRPDLFG